MTVSELIDRLWKCSGNALVHLYVNGEETDDFNIIEVDDIVTIGQVAPYDEDMQR